ncbi:unnamed protein product [Adineta ricciae]|uniref:Uncharacterized protein n=1 Tax=Adineta ricciae TaxID=249248 RepID=A0A814PM16_ADIRI|nr:unnamed protein product [Adineta ricciae]
MENTCACQNTNGSCQIIENYRSILDRKHSFLSSWQPFDDNGKTRFKRRRQYRAKMNASLIHMCPVYVVNPWYEYVDISRHLLSFLRKSQYVRIFEIVLLECNCSTNLCKYELAIIECPCLRNLQSYCAYCQLICQMVEQTNISFSLNCNAYHEAENDFLTVNNDQKSRLLRFQTSDSTTDKTILLLQDDGNEDQYSVQSKAQDYSVNSSLSYHCLSQNARSSPSSIQTIKHKAASLGTQTKLYAILLPNSPLCELNDARIETKMIMSVTRSCQVNTLCYIVKTNERLPDHTYLKTDDQKSRPIDDLSPASQKTQNSKQKFISVESINGRHHRKCFNSGIQRGLTLTPSMPLKCINACDAIDCNDSKYKSVPKFLNNSNEQQINNNNHNEKSVPDCVKVTTGKSSRKVNSYRLFLRQRRRERNRKCIRHFLSQFYSRTKSVTSHPSLSTNITSYYKVHDHVIIVRASQNSAACQHLQIILNQSNSSLNQLIDSQFLLTSQNNYQSVCILFDNHKQSEAHRSSFLRYIYQSLSNILKCTIQNRSIQITCMNLVFFNNSIYDLTRMQRIRLIDTGKQVIFRPSCEISLKTSDDVDTVINRVSMPMPFAHRIFIVNFHHEQSSLSGSFLFLHLAPICSVRSTGLLTNLNSTTYSIMNLIRQLKNGHLSDQKTKKRFLLNDYTLNRLLKTYLFSPKHTMIVFTVRSNEFDCEKSSLEK